MANARKQSKAKKAHTQRENSKKCERLREETARKDSWVGRGGEMCRWEAVWKSDETTKKRKAKKKHTRAYAHTRVNTQHNKTKQRQRKKNTEPTKKKTSNRKQKKPNRRGENAVQKTECVLCVCVHFCCC
eukprot:TRINITY_DN2745_c3_g2_i2.p2 TRINITY_DN2745_c3_g2~~TRINITY_DN2745_c3_g2_i2.p2  ORF type:complete len:130 (+),score=1.47 TRINITY_DN2745_c3_g2_i2:1286-1675(+)